MILNPGDHVFALRRSAVALTDTPCPAFGVGCRGFLADDGVCSTCGAVASPPKAPRGNSVRSRYDDEPDWESIVEARAEAWAERDLERAEAAYERWIYGD